MIPPSVHYLKCDPEYYAEVARGTKLFEVRKNDRDFQKGDTLVLEEFNPTSYIYTGRKSAWSVTCILSKHPGLRRGYVVMSIRPCALPS